MKLKSLQKAFEMKINSNNKLKNNMLNKKKFQKNYKE